MKGKQLALLLALVLVLGGVWYLLSIRKTGSWSESTGGGGKVVDFPINDVAHVQIKRTDGEVNLNKKGEIWTVQERADFPASFDQVSELLRKLWELKTVQVVQVGPSQLPRLELVAPGSGDKSGTLVELSTADGKPISSLLLGKKQFRKSDGGDMDMGMGGPSEGFPTGRYVKPANGAKVSLVSATLEEVDPKAERWLAKDFFKIENPKSITVAGPAETQRFTLTRDDQNAEWKLADAKPEEKVDAGKVSPVGSAFSAPSFNDVLAPDAKLEDPVTTVTVDTFDGFHYDLKVGKPNGENYPVTVAVSANIAKERTPGKDEKPEDKTRLDTEFTTKQKKLEEKLASEKKVEGRPYLLPKFTVDPYLKNRADLLADKPAEPAKPGDPAAPGQPANPATPPVAIPPAPPAPPASAPAAPPKPSTAAPEPATPPPAATPEAKPTTPAPAVAPANPPPAADASTTPARTRVVTEPAPGAAPSAPVTPPVPPVLPPVPPAPVPLPAPPVTVPPAPAEPAANPNAVPATPPAPKVEAVTPPVQAPPPAAPSDSGAAKPAPAAPPADPAPAPAPDKP